MRNTLVLCAITVAGGAQANLVLNGGFENNVAGGNIDNMANATWNATVANSTGYGASEELDLYNPTGYGPPPCEGNWKAAMHSKAAAAMSDAFTLDLSAPLVVGQTYRLSFCAVTNDDFFGGPGDLNIGISSSATAFGTLIYNTGAIAIGSWTTYSTNFVASSAATYLSVETVATNTGWSHVDDFQVDVVPEPASLSALAIGALALLRRRR